MQNIVNAAVVAAVFALSAAFAGSAAFITHVVAIAAGVIQ